VRGPELKPKHCQKETNKNTYIIVTALRGIYNSLKEKRIESVIGKLSVLSEEYIPIKFDEEGLEM
jgi:hypothetical protein